MSNLLIKNTELGIEKIFPKNYILNLIDKDSGKNLQLILNSFNMLFLSYAGNKAETRKQVPLSLRKLGLWITYVIGKTVVIEWYNSNAIDDNTWGSSTYWMLGSNTLVGDITISSQGTWVVNGEDTGISPKGDKGDSPLIRIYNNKILVSYDKGVTYLDLNNTPVYTKFRFNSWTNTYLVSYDLEGTWQDISNEKVYHKFRYNNSTNTYQESIDFGKTWSNISAEKVYYLFRTNDNRLLVSTDLGTTWGNCSEPIAAWFRWADASGTGNIGKIQISRDLQNWEDLSPTITNNLYIKGYVSTVGELPTSSADIGDIYMVGPTYDESDTTLDYPHYRMWVKLSSGWVDNGEFLSVETVSSYQDTDPSKIESAKTHVMTHSGNVIKPMTDFNSVFNAAGKSLAEFESEILYDVSAHNDGAVFESLSALLSSSNLSTLIPTSVRHGGMTIRFIQGSEQSSDNKYVQWRYMLDDAATNSKFTNVFNWQGVESIPTVGSANLVEGSGIVKSLKNIAPSLVLNKFNKDGSNVALGKYLDYKDGITLLDFPAWNTTDFIEVNPNKLYDIVSFKGGVKGNIINGHIYGYDENKNFIEVSAYEFGSAQNKTLAEFLQLNPIPSNVKYVRFSFENQDWDYCVFAEKYITDTINAYVSFGTTLFDITDKLQGDYDILSGSVEDLNGSVEDLNGSVNQIKSLIVLENLFNKEDEDCAIGKYLDYNNGITLLDFPAWNTTGFIEINVQNTYDMVSFKGGVKGNINNGHIYGYDENKNFINISLEEFGSSQNRTLAEFLQLYPMPSNVKYVRFSFENQDWDYCVFAEKYTTETLESYIPFGIHSVLDEISEQIQQNDIKIDDLQKNAINYDGIVKSINRIADGVPYPIQTLVAYKYVVKKFGYRILLCDLLFTSDNVPVLSHDAYLNQYYNNVRMADGSPIPDPSIEANRVYFNQTPYQTLYDNYDFGVYRSSQFAGIKLQKFEDFVKMCRNLGVLIYVEIKQMTVAQAQIATSIVQKYGMVDKTSWAADMDQTALMQEIVRLLPTARVSYMPPENITNSHIDMAAALKNGQNEVFLFGWDSTNLTDALVSYMVEKDVAFEIGTLNTKQAILSYFDRSDAQKYCTGIETQTIIAGKVLYENELELTLLL